MNKLSLSNIKELVQHHIANKVKDPGFKFSQLGYSQYGPTIKVHFVFLPVYFFLLKCSCCTILYVLGVQYSDSQHFNV